MNLLDYRLATILQVGIALAARMFELRQLRRRVQIAELSARRRRRRSHRAAAQRGGHAISDSGLGGMYD